MDISSNINAQRPAIDLSHFSKHQNLSGKEATAPPNTGKTPTETSMNASTVNLSQEGLGASVAFDFNATTENFAKMDTLRDSEYFPNAHGAISYEKVKELLV